MKKRIIAIGLVFMFILCGCNKGKDDTVTISQDEFDELMSKAVSAQSNKEAADALEELEDTTGKDIPIEAFTGVEEGDEEEDTSSDTLERFPYPISDEIKNSEIFDGAVQIYKEVYRIDYSMTPQQVYDNLMSCDRKDLFDAEIKYDSDNIPRDVKVYQIGSKQECGDFYFAKYEPEEELVFDDETIKNTIPAPDNNYYLVGFSDFPYYYYTTMNDGLPSAADNYFSGGISTSGRGIDGERWSNEDMLKVLAEEGFVEVPKGIILDDSIEDASGMYDFYGVVSTRVYFDVIKHMPEFDYCDITYTMDKVEYVEHYTGMKMRCEFKDKYNSITPVGIGSTSLYYRGELAIEKIEKRLKELGLESKISAEINNAHMND